MTFEIRFERIYPHPPEKVWHAITDPAALGEWLMQTDVRPEPGRAFRMWCDEGAGGTATYLCEVLAYEPPRRMLWSWVQDGSRNAGRMLVEFRLEAVSGGTRLTIKHSGEVDDSTIERFRGGWPVKMQSLESRLSACQRRRR